MTDDGRLDSAPIRAQLTVGPLRTEPGRGLAAAQMQEACERFSAALEVWAEHLVRPVAEHVRTVFAATAANVAEIHARHPELFPPVAPTDPRERALRARRAPGRTGPPTARLDGRRR